jgi:predicted metalloprotease with PDZ domain
MKVNYLIDIQAPHTHMVCVKMSFDSNQKESHEIFMPSWSPGSYLMREYARHIRSLKVTSQTGEELFFEQKQKGVWLIQPSSKTTRIEISYEVFCHELTVRTSHVDQSHAFLHLPTLLMGVIGEDLKSPILEVKFPALWSKISTGLKEISKVRSEFVFTANDYDELIDSPIEIGCHETDGFMLENKPHALAFYGTQYPHGKNLKEDMKTIVETIAKTMGGTPYESYTFITHFVPKIYGGLEHLNSTALHFDGRKLANRKDYINWLCLVSHEYFHLWNVKRIRPKELGPFDYLNEGYTRLLWLAEGLTSFMDNLFVYRAGLITLAEYLELIRADFDTYYSTPGRKFHSLDDSSFNAWVKLYRPDENSKNSSISYYLKGGLVFSVLNTLLFDKNINFDLFLKKLWDHYLKNPQIGLERDELFTMIEEISDSQTKNIFEEMVETTKEIEFESYYKKIGLEFVWETSKNNFYGIDFEYKGDRVFIKAISLDCYAMKAGLNAGDEIIAINGLRLTKEDLDTVGKTLCASTSYQFLVSRLESMVTVNVLVETPPKVLKELKVIDEEKLKKALKGFM